MILIISRIEENIFRFEVKDTGIGLRERSRRRYLTHSPKQMEVPQGLWGDGIRFDNI